MADHIKREMRYFRNWYICEACTVAGSEWADELLTKGSSFCPCCDREVEPYASDELFDEFMDDDDEDM